MISCYVIAMHLLGVVDGCCYAVSKGCDGCKGVAM